jgi:hypothetical protein
MIDGLSVIETAAAGGVVFATRQNMDDVVRSVWNLYGEPTIESIAQSLARQCRYNGHCRAFYSVAQHSILVSDQFADPGLALWGLLHDAAEAWIGDVVRPLKRMLWVGPPYRSLDWIEQQLIDRLATRFHPGGLIVPAAVVNADNRAMVTEVRDLKPRYTGRMPDVEPFAERIEAWPYGVAEVRFLRRFAEVDEARKAGRLL